MICEIKNDELFMLAEKFFKKQRVQDAILTRLCSDPNVFFPNKFCVSYKVLKGDKLCTLMTQSSGLLSIFSVKTPDLEELAGFISALPVSKIECSKKLYKKLKKHLDFLEATEGKIFYYNKEAPQRDFLAQQTDDASSFYDTVKISHKVYEKIPFEAFYCDYFYRSRLPAKLFLTFKGEKAVATAAIMHGYRNAKILSDISVLPEERRQGFAEDIVLKAVSTVLSEGKMPMLFCTAPPAMSLYKKLGFKTGHKFVYITL